MTTLTPNYSLILYNSTTDATQTFLDWRSDIDGTSVGSNFYLIDTALDDIQTQVTALQGLKNIIPVPAIFSTGSLFEATGITEIAAYENNMVIMLVLDENCPGTTTLNINSLGVKTLIKKDSAGSTANLAAKDLIKNRYYFFRYDAATNYWLWINATSSDQINISGTANNVVTVSSVGSLEGTVTQSYLLSNTVNTATAKTSLANNDKIGLVDSADSNILKYITWANIKTLLGSLFIAAGTIPTTTALSDFQLGNGSGAWVKKTLSEVMTILGISNTNTGDITLASMGSTANANGASLSGQELTLQPANLTYGGIITTGTQSIAGNKTFTGYMSMGISHTIPATEDGSNVYYFSPPADYGLLSVQSRSAPSTNYVFGFYVKTSGGVITSYNIGTNVVLMTGVLSGTTGTTGKLNISVDSSGDGTIYVENRTGTSKNIVIKTF